VSAPARARRAAWRAQRDTLSRDAELEADTLQSEGFTYPAYAALTAHHNHRSWWDGLITEFLDLREDWHRAA